MGWSMEMFGAMRIRVDAGRTPNGERFGGFSRAHNPMMTPAQLTGSNFLNTASQLFAHILQRVVPGFPGLGFNSAGDLIQA